jgi:hypothetical protein
MRRENYEFTATGFKSGTRAKTLAYDTARKLGSLPGAPQQD